MNGTMPARDRSDRRVNSAPGIRTCTGYAWLFADWSAELRNLNAEQTKQKPPA